MSYKSYPDKFYNYITRVINGQNSNVLENMIL